MIDLFKINNNFLKKSWDIFIFLLLIKENVADLTLASCLLIIFKNPMTVFK
jgi:hypothetical protein